MPAYKMAQMIETPFVSLAAAAAAEPAEFEQTRAAKREEASAAVSNPFSV